MNQDQTNKPIVYELYGRKVRQLQAFDGQNFRIPLTELIIEPHVIKKIKLIDSADGYASIKIEFGLKSPQEREIKFASGRELTNLTQGTILNISDVFAEGDKVKITGTSKGRGFTGVVKRHHFKGGPRTHGQSDRERAPGSIGQTTTPGRVYKGKRMAGRSGGQKTTVKNLQIFKIDNQNNRVFLKGLVPGFVNTLIKLSRN